MKPTYALEFDRGLVRLSCTREGRTVKTPLLEPGKVRMIIEGIPSRKDRELAELAWDTTYWRLRRGHP
jgi:hypothetical protein